MVGVCQKSFTVLPPPFEYKIFRVSHCFCFCGHWVGGPLPTVPVGGNETVWFQFTAGYTVNNITSLPLKGPWCRWTTAQITSFPDLIMIDVRWTNGSDGFTLLGLDSCGFILPFGNTTSLHFAQGVNCLVLYYNASGITIKNFRTSTAITIKNSSPVIGIGIYEPTTPATFCWMFSNATLFGIPVQGESFQVLTGSSPNNLHTSIIGQSGFDGLVGVNVPVTTYPEYVEIEWLMNQQVVAKCIMELPVCPPSSSTFHPFNNTIQPNSRLYNFCAYQPWVTIIGIVVIAVITLLGWKFSGNAGALGGAVMGIITTAYLGLFPWWVFYIFVLGIAMLVAKILVDRFIGSIGD